MQSQISAPVPLHGSTSWRSGPIHIRIDKLTARHIQRFIDNLGEDGISAKRDLAKPKDDLSAILKGRTQKDLAETSGVSRSTISSMCRGEGVTLTTAEKISTALERSTKDLFTIQRSNGKLSPKSIQHYLSFVSSVLDYAFRFEMISSNPCKRVVIPSGEAPERECYTVEEAQAFLDSLNHAPTKYKAFFVLAIYGGFRRGELLGLEWEDIDFQAKVVKIRRTSQYLPGRGTFTDDTKTEKSHRTLKLPAPVFNVLKRLQIEQTQDRLRLGDQWHNSGRLFVGDTGEPIHPNTPYHWLRRFCEDTGQRFLGIHAFRHLNASLLINSGVDVKTVSASLGHSQVTTTLNIYAHTFEEAQARASEAVADLLTKKQA
ncbi:tyrosine-type recombinase/integrase [Flintibacter sp. HCN-6482]|uniref:tyrosine-type recombinase/integrase n=1 Tax=Flintibacter sp. HCN-6482 TaxID=3134672 RepID=UPI0030C2786C